MILAILICLLLSWGLARMDRRRSGSNKTDLHHLAATFAASSFITLVFAAGTASQGFVEAYVSGRLDELIADLQNEPGYVIMTYAGNAFLLALLYAIPATILLHYSRSFLGGVVWATLGALALELAQFLIFYWSRPYPGSAGLTIFLTTLGMAITSYFAQALRCEIHGAAPTASRKRQRGLVWKITGAGMALSVIVSFAFYYFLVFAIPKPVAFKFSKWEHLSVVGTMEHPVHVGLFAEDLDYQPSIPFQQGVLEEEAMRNPLTGELPRQPSRIQLHFAHVLHPTYTMTNAVMLGQAGVPPSFGGFRLTVQRFSHCSVRDIALLHRRMVSGEAGTRVAVETTGMLEFQTYQAWIFHPNQTAPDLNIMLPAWNHDWVHIFPLEGGRGATVGSQAPLAGRARAMILNPAGIYLVVAVNPEPTSTDRLFVQRAGRPRPNPIGNIHACNPAGQSGRQIGGFIPWQQITTNDRSHLSGYLMEIGAAVDRPVDQTPGQYLFRFENADTPTTLKETLTVPLADRNPVNSLVTGVQADTIGVGMVREIGQLDGTFGSRSFARREFVNAIISGDHLELRDDPSRPGGLRLSGNARHVSLDGEQNFYTFAGQISEPVGWTISGFLFSGLLALLVFLWRRIPGYEAGCFRARAVIGPEEIRPDRADGDA